MARVLSSIRHWTQKVPFDTNWEMNAYLETARIYLRNFEPGDESNLLDLDNDPDVMRYITDGASSTPDQILNMIARIKFLREKYNGRFGVWLALEKSSAEFIGWFHFRPAKSDPKNTKRIELGYRLKKQFWGRGYATEVSRALISKGFSELGVEEVFAVAMKGNRASQKVMEKSGLQYTGACIHHEFPGEDKAAVVYSAVKTQ